LANEKPLCATELLQVHLENGGERVHSETIRRMPEFDSSRHKIHLLSNKNKGLGAEIRISCGGTFLFKNY
jgi:hypothetical protein